MTAILSGFVARACQGRLKTISITNSESPDSKVYSLVTVRPVEPSRRGWTIVKLTMSTVEGKPMAAAQPSVAIFEYILFFFQFFKSL